jgi:hypothetical protein
LYFSCLRSFRTLHNFEFHCIAFLQYAIAVTSNRGIMDKNIRTIRATNETIALRIVEPLYRSLVQKIPGMPAVIITFRFIWPARSIRSESVWGFAVDLASLVRARGKVPV